MSSKDIGIKNSLATRLNKTRGQNIAVAECHLGLSKLFPLLDRKVRGQEYSHPRRWVACSAGMSSMNGVHSYIFSFMAELVLMTRYIGGQPSTGT